MLLKKFNSGVFSDADQVRFAFKKYIKKIMAKIVQTLTRASSEYNEDVAQSLIRDLDAVLEKVNTTFQEELKQEIEARSFFFRLMAVVNQYKFVGIDDSTSGLH